MTNRRDSHPEAQLQRVITGLEQETPRGWYGALLELCTYGPLLFAGHTLLAEYDRPLADRPAADAPIRQDLITFLRDVVRVQGSREWPQALTVTGPIEFSSSVLPNNVVFTAAEASFSDACKLQLVWLLHEVGIRNVRRCQAADCPHLFVRTYRQAYCSVRCQQREYKRRERHADREAREKQAQQVRRRRVTKGQR